MSNKFPEIAHTKQNNSHIQVVTNRLRMIHAMKLYYNRMHYWINNIPDGHDDQKDFFRREAVITLMKIRELEDRELETKFIKKEELCLSN